MKAREKKGRGKVKAGNANPGRVSHRGGSISTAAGRRKKRRRKGTLRPTEERFTPKTVEEEEAIRGEKEEGKTGEAERGEDAP